MEIFIYTDKKMSVYIKNAILRKIQMSVDRRVYFQRTITTLSEASKRITASPEVSDNAVPALQEIILDQLINPL